MYFGGTVVGEQAMKSEEDVGSLIEYEFRVSGHSWPSQSVYQKLTYAVYDLEYVTINKRDKGSLPVFIHHTGLV